MLLLKNISVCTCTEHRKQVESEWFLVLKMLDPTPSCSFVFQEIFFWTFFVFFFNF